MAYVIIWKREVGKWPKDFIISIQLLVNREPVFFFFAGLPLSGIK